MTGFGQVPDEAGGAGLHTADASDQVVDQSQAAVPSQRRVVWRRAERALAYAWLRLTSWASCRVVA